MEKVPQGRKGLPEGGHAGAGGRAISAGGVLRHSGIRGPIAPRPRRRRLRRRGGRHPTRCPSGTLAIQADPPARQGRRDRRGSHRVPARQADGRCVSRSPSRSAPRYRCRSRVRTYPQGRAAGATDARDGERPSLAAPWSPRGRTHRVGDHSWPRDHRRHNHAARHRHGFRSRSAPDPTPDSAGLQRRRVERSLGRDRSQALVETLALLERTDPPPKPVPQDEERATYAPKLTREIARIDWTKDARSISGLIRGLDPRPGAWAELDGVEVKLFNPKVNEPPFPGTGAPGEVLSTDGTVVIATGPV